jgi:murein DD-endopeptidase MepM/ murein hydrolase activator NlpD
LLKKFHATFALLIILSACAPAVHRPIAPANTAGPDTAITKPLKTYNLLSPFGKRGSRFHTGIDIRGKRGGGDPVFAAWGGRVVRAGVLSSYGKLVEIKHENGFSTRYAHLRRVDVKVGQKVKAGTAIGIVGSTGRATTAHLHFELLTAKSLFMDPAPYLFPRKKS